MLILKEMKVSSSGTVSGLIAVLNLSVVISLNDAGGA